MIVDVYRFRSKCQWLQKQQMCGNSKIISGLWLGIHFVSNIRFILHHRISESPSNTLCGCVFPRAKPIWLVKMTQKGEKTDHKHPNRCEKTLHSGSRRQKTSLWIKIIIFRVDCKSMLDMFTTWQCTFINIQLCCSLFAWYNLNYVQCHLDSSCLSAGLLNAACFCPFRDILGLWVTDFNFTVTLLSEYCTIMSVNVSSNTTMLSIGVVFREVATIYALALCVEMTVSLLLWNTFWL